MDTRTNPTELANRIAARYAELPPVTAVALAGSQTTRAADSGSDLDLYVYTHSELDLTDRAAVATTDSSRVEVDNRFWEPGDEWIDTATGIKVDVMFRPVTWITEQIDRVLVRHEASVGYSTCFWHNVLTAQPLFDRASWFATLQDRARAAYPEELRAAIIAKNFPILAATHSAYLHQLAAAARRNDPVSLNHRVTALLASYFDILCALNRKPHPGEKQLLTWVETNCPLRPPQMRDQVTTLIQMAANAPERVVPAVEALVADLAALLRAEGCRT